MRIEQTSRKQQLSLLLAVLLLVANTLVTAHVFGEPVHVVADNCDLLHQLERQQQAPTGVSPIATETGRHVLPASRPPVAIAVVAVRHYQSRAPPFA